MSYVTRLLRRLAERFDPEVLGASLGDLLVRMAAAGLVFAVYYLVWWLGVKKLLTPALRRTRLDRTTVAFLENLLKYALLAVGAVEALGEIGVSTASLVAGLGVTGLTLGFAARDSLSNIISGLFIFWDRPFVIGDLIEVGQQYGRVDRITLRSTRVVTVDGRMLAIPNSDMVNKTVASYTNFPHLRIDVPITVGVGEDLASVREHLLDVIREDPAYMKKPEPRVVVKELLDYAVVMEIQVWLDDERRHVGRRYELREKAYDTLRAAGVEIPFETLSLTPVEVRRAG